MKAKAHEVDAIISKPSSHNAAFIYGPDEGLVRHRAKAMSDAWLGKNADPLMRVTLSGDQLKEDPAKLFDEMQSMSLMGDQRVILVRDVGEANAADIEEAYALASPENRLLVLGGDLAPKSKLRAGAEKHTNCIALPCYKEEGRGLEKLIRETLTGFGLQADAGAMAYLTGHLHGDRMVILNELEKLSIYMGEEEHITEDMAIQVVGDPSEQGYDDICYAISGGDVVKAMRALDKCWAQGEAPVVILRALQRHFLRFQALDSLAQKGFQGEAAVKQLRPPVFFKYSRILASQATRWRGKKLISALQLLQKTESDCKGNFAAVELLCAQQLLQLTKAA